MKGVILAGGVGSRLRPVTLEIPKPLITIRKKPLINYNIDNFTKHGVHDIKIIIRPSDRPDYERWYREYKNEFPDTKINIIEESEPMGTLGYLFHHLSEWMGDDHVFVTNADDIKNVDLGTMLAFHRRSGFPATIALMNMEKPDEYGAVVLRGDTIVSFLEKKPGLAEALVSCGLYIISPAALAAVENESGKDKKFLMFEKELFPVLARDEKLGAFVCEGTFYDCGTLERWEKAIREL